MHRTVCFKFPFRTECLIITFNSYFFIIFFIFLPFSFNMYVSMQFESVYGLEVLVIAV